jgi:hypothetical protein
VPDPKTPRDSGQTAPPPVETPDPAARVPARGPAPTSRSVEVADFLAKVRSLPNPAATDRGRLVFAMDATMSREPTWDMALTIQADMFRAVKSLGTLDVQLVYFRGAGECRASRWVSDPEALARLMTGVTCRGGQTQVGRVLAHARSESAQKRVHALAVVGDAMEEPIDEVCARAGELALAGVPVFLFQEGRDFGCERAFREIARLTRGAWCRFDAGAAAELSALLAAVAVYATGGLAALEQSRAAGARLLLGRMKYGQ